MIVRESHPASLRGPPGARAVSCCEFCILLLGQGSCTPLVGAVEDGSLEVVQVLLAAGADPAIPRVR